MSKMKESPNTLYRKNFNQTRCNTPTRKRISEVEKRLSLCIALKRSDNIICCICPFSIFQLADNHVQPFQVPFHAFLHGKEQIASFRTTDNDTALSFIPFILKYPVIRL